MKEGEINISGPIDSAQSVNLSGTHAAPEKPVAETNTTQTSTEDLKVTADGETTDDTKKETGEEGAGEDQLPDYKGEDGKYVHPDTKAEASADEMIEYFRDKFSGSTSGAQQLMGENKTLTEKVESVGAELEDSNKKIEEYRKVSEKENPEGLKLVDLQTSNEKLTKDLALAREQIALDGFEKTTPLAASKRDALRSLARANPSTPLQKLWDDNLKAGAEAVAKKITQKKDAQRKGAGDSGRGTSTREPAANTVGNTGLSLKEFNALPVAERQKLLAK